MLLAIGAPFLYFSFILFSGLEVWVHSIFSSVKISSETGSEESIDYESGITMTNTKSKN